MIGPQFRLFPFRGPALHGLGQTDLSTLPDLPVPQPPPLATTGTFMTPQGPVNVSSGVYMGTAPAATTTSTAMNWLPWVIGGVVVGGGFRANSRKYGSEK